MAWRSVLILVALLGLAVSFGSYMWNYQGSRTERELQRAQATVSALQAGGGVAVAATDGGESAVARSAFVAPSPMEQSAIVTDTTGAYRDTPAVDPTPVLAAPAAPSQQSREAAQSFSPVEVAPIVLPSGWYMVSLFSAVPLADGTYQVCVNVAYR